MTGAESAATLDRLEREARAICAGLASGREPIERQAGELRGVLTRLRAIASELDAAVAAVPTDEPPQHP